MTDSTLPTQKQKKPLPPAIGFSVVADFWLLGAIFLYAPAYLGILGGWQTPFVIVGFVCLAISILGAGTELGKLLKSDGVNYLGISLVFLIPGIALYIAVHNNLIANAFITVAKIAFLLLTAFGGFLLFHSIPYFFWKKEEPKSNPENPEELKKAKAEKIKTNFEIVASIVIALLSLATAVVTLVEKVLP